MAAIFMVTLVFGTIYAAVQQTQRRAANYPQIQIAEDAAALIKTGQQPTFPEPRLGVDIKHSLRPFTIIYNKQGKAVLGDGYLNSRLPSFPIEALKAAKNQPYNAVTWQPQPGVRIAAITVAANEYYVLSGRSLREIDRDAALNLELATTSMTFGLLIIGLVYLVQRRSRPKDVAHKSKKYRK